MDVASKKVVRHKLPFMCWRTTQWLADPKIRACSLGARGLWLDIMAAMWDAPRRGVLQVETPGVVPPNVSAKQSVECLSPALARIVGATRDEVDPLLAELVRREVVTMMVDGAIISPDILRADAVAQRAKESNKRRAKYGHRGAAHGGKGGRPVGTQGEEVSVPVESEPIRAAMAKAMEPVVAPRMPKVDPLMHAAFALWNAEWGTRGAPGDIWVPGRGDGAAMRKALKLAGRDMLKLKRAISLLFQTAADPSPSLLVARWGTMWHTDLGTEAKRIGE